MLSGKGNSKHWAGKPKTGKRVSWPKKNENK